MPRKRREGPWLGKRGDTYYAFWYDEKTKRTERLSLATQDDDEAREAFALFLTAGVDKLSSKAAAASGITGAHVIDDYLREKGGVLADWDAGTWEGNPEVQGVGAKERLFFAGKALMTFFGGMPVEEIDVKTCALYEKRRKEGTLGRKVQGPTIRRELSMLITACRHAAKHKRIKQTDVPMIDLPEKSAPRERWLTVREMEALLSAARGQEERGNWRTSAFVRLAYYFCSRQEAVRSLTVFQVDTERWRVDLNPPGRRRTKKRRPIIPIHPDIQPLVLELLERCRADGTPHLLGHAGAIRKGFEAARNRAGLGTDVTPHTLRHSRITHLLQQGVSPWVVAGISGDTVETIMQTYGHHCPDHLAAATADVGSLPSLSEVARDASTGAFLRPAGGLKRGANTGA